MRLWPRALDGHLDAALADSPPKDPLPPPADAGSSRQFGDANRQPGGGEHHQPQPMVLCYSKIVKASMA